jgi:hypothetical protein
MTKISRRSPTLPSQWFRAPARLYILISTIETTAYGVYREVQAESNSNNVSPKIQNGRHVVMF